MTTTKNAQHQQRRQKRRPPPQSYTQQPVQEFSDYQQNAATQETLPNDYMLYQQQLMAYYASQMNYQYGETANAFDTQNQQQYLENNDSYNLPARKVRKRKVRQGDPNTTKQRSNKTSQEHGNSVENFDTQKSEKFAQDTEHLGTDALPIIGYADEPLLSLADACEPLSNILFNLPFYVNMALQETPDEPPDGLTTDESAAVRLYTIEWESPHRSLYSMLNYTLKNCSREELQPYFRYMKLFLTALAKMPCCPSLTVWRGVTKDLSAEFLPGTRVTWWPFSSTTTELTVLENSMYLGKQGARTLFSVEAMNGRTIKAHSHFITEDEILLLPGTHMIVQSQFSPANDLYIIHLKQVIPEEVLLEPPFEGAHLYPKPKRPWYRKKKVMIPLCLAVIMCIVAAVVGGVIGSSKAGQIHPFPSSASYDSGPVPSVIVYGHFNYDNKVDIAVSNLGDRTIDILLNSGNGAFPKVSTFVTGISPNFITICPIDRNNVLVIVVNNLDESISVGTYNAELGLDLSSDYSVGGDPRAALCGDFNNDTVVDVAVVCAADGTLVLLLSQNNESFQQSFFYSIQYSPITILSSSVNSYGDREFVILDYSSIYKLAIDSNTSYSYNRDFAQVLYAVAGTTGDFDHDNQTDYAIVYSNPNMITIYFAGVLNIPEQQIIYNLNNPSNSITSAHLNNDHALDLILTVSYGNSIDILLGFGNRSFASSQSYDVGSYPAVAIASDVSNDSALDIIVANAGSNTISVLINYGDGTFKPQTMYVCGQSPVSLVAYDFTNDKKIDVLVVNSLDNNVALLLGNGDGSFQARIPFKIGIKVSYMAAGDFDNNSLTDLVVTNRQSRSLSILMTISSGTLNLTYNYTSGMIPKNVATSDFNTDGHLDIITVDDKNNSVSVFLGYGDGTFKNASGSITSATGRQPSSFAIADFNGDKRLDLAVIGVPDKNVSVLFGDGKGAFTINEFYKIGKAQDDIIAVSLTGSWLDLVVANVGDGTLSFLYNLGKGNFEKQVTYNTVKSPTVLLYGDFNRDGIIDLAVISEKQNQQIILINDGKRAFTQAQTISVPSPNGGIAHDFNNDGYIDIAIISKTGGLYVYINQKT